MQLPRPNQTLASFIPPVHTTMAPPPPPPLVVDDLVEEVLLRLPPDDPAQLLRAALVCTLWGRIVSDAGFRRRFHEFHRSPPMLGFFCKVDGDGPSNNRFVPTSASCPPIADHGGYRVLDARQGRVLLLAKPPVQKCDWELAVWDPIAGERQDLPKLPRFADTYNASVLCGGGAACGSHICHCKQFLVVFIGTDKSAGYFCCVYSSESGAWSEPTSMQAQSPIFWCIDPVPGALAENALHFLILMGSKILKFDLGTKAFSVINLPDDYYSSVAPMATNDGGLGFVGVVDTKLHLWSWKTDYNVQQARWVQNRTIRLEKWLPVDEPFLLPDFLAILDGTGVFLVMTIDGIFSIDLKTLKVRKLYRYGGCDNKNIVPFASFYTPALGVASSRGEQRAGASSSA